MTIPEYFSSAYHHFFFTFKYMDIKNGNRITRCTDADEERMV